MPLCSRRTVSVLLICLSLILVGTCVVLGSVWSFFHVDRRAMITPEEIQMVVASWASAAGSAAAAAAVASQANAALPGAMRIPPPAPPSPSPRGRAMQTARQPVSSAAPRINGTGAPRASSAPDPAVYEGHFTPGRQPKDIRPGEKIPRIIHQTWKTDTLPDKWAPNREECMRMHPDYDYILWTDENSRAFIEKHYNWFLPVFDGYPYPIQRADAIRYFVLHHFGGIYMDLDMGCLKPMGPLLSFEAVLPETAPIGVSNDLMMITPQHPFMKRLLNHLALFNHNYILHYPTVMFSTGPMLVSASYSLWVDANGVSLPSDVEHPTRGRSGVRVLPKSLYGKNLPRELARQHAFFKHFYGSSWHANDASFIQALGKGGKYLFLVTLVGVVYGLLRRAQVVPPFMLARIVGPVIRLVYTTIRALGLRPPGSHAGAEYTRRSGYIRRTTQQAERENLLVGEGEEAFALEQPKRATSFSTRIDMPPGSGDSHSSVLFDSGEPASTVTTSPSAPVAFHQRSATLDVARTPSPSRFAQAFLSQTRTESPPSASHLSAQSYNLRYNAHDQHDRAA